MKFIFSLVWILCGVECWAMLIFLYSMNDPLSLSFFHLACPLFLFITLRLFAYVSGGGGRWWWQWITCFFVNSEKQRSKYFKDFSLSQTNRPTKPIGREKGSLPLNRERSLLKELARDSRRELSKKIGCRPAP